MRLWRYCFAALLFDGLLYITFAVLPIRAVELNATPTQLGLLPMGSAMVYILCCPFMGRLADRGSRTILVRLGSLIMIGVCLVLGRIDSLTGLFIFVPLLGLGAGLFWPTLEGSIGAEFDPQSLEKSIGRFNVMWSTGKMLGFISGGWMKGELGPAVAFGTAAAAAAAVFLLYPWRDAPRNAKPRETAHEQSRPIYRTLGYIANFISFGTGSTLANQFYKYLTETPLSLPFPRETFFGLFLGTIFGTQTILFLVLRRGTGWTYRRVLLYAAQGLLAACLVTLTTVNQGMILLALASLAGMTMGFIYNSSIYYSLHGPSHHGKYSGLHEAMQGAGVFLMPLAGGALADLTGDLRAPYLLAAGAILAAVALEEILYRTRSSSSSNRSIR